MQGPSDKARSLIAETSTLLDKSATLIQRSSSLQDELNRLTSYVEDVDRQSRERPGRSERNAITRLLVRRHR